ncbi:dihydroorotase [Hahella sp. HN01]|uniref:dihydroorotase n=1 Tax=Hahella sp. HN01 TaxID=2847262 RepID=UPI001C1ECBB5|nr:dihydroorotase [Hahella sp. HN01]
MSGRILIKGGRIIDPSQSLDTQSDLYIADGEVVAIGAAPADFNADMMIEAAGSWVTPGLVDLCAYLREPGYEHKASIASESLAAVKGGFTTLCCPPATSPVNDTAAVTNLIYDQALTAGKAKILPIGALTKGLAGEQLSEMHALREAGCVGVSNLRYPFRDNQVMKRCLEYACSQDITIFVCPEDYALAKDGCVHEGATSGLLGLSGIPAIAETMAVAQWLILAEETEARIHLGQLSCAKSVELVADAKRRGLKVTCDVALANLIYTDAVIKDFNPAFHVRPPLRREEDRKALLKGVNDGVIDAICSHHQPHESAAKLAPFAETRSGMSVIELVLPQIIALTTSGELRLDAAMRALTTGPAQVLELSTGSLQIGSAADVALIDPTEKWLVTESNLVSKGKNCPWLDTEVVGLAYKTIVEGRVVYDRALMME